jgi:hypothetical protein
MALGLAPLTHTIYALRVSMCPSYSHGQSLLLAFGSTYEFLPSVTILAFAPAEFPFLSTHHFTPHELCDSLIPHAPNDGLDSP